MLRNNIFGLLKIRKMSKKRNTKKGKKKLVARPARYQVEIAIAKRELDLRTRSASVKKPKYSRKKKHKGGNDA